MTMHGYFTVKKLCELWNNNKKKKSRTFSLEYNDWNVYKISCSTELFSFRMKKSVDSSFFWIGEFIVRQMVPLCSGMLNKLITNLVSSVSALLKKNWPKWHFFFSFPNYWTRRFQFSPPQLCRDLALQNSKNFSLAFEMKKQLFS